LARSFFGPVVRPARGGVSGSGSASRPKAAPQETQDTGNAGQAWQTWDRHSSRVRSPSVTRRGCPCPVRRTFADAFLASAHSMPTALRHPGFACRHTPALGARATPPPPPSRADIGQAWDRHRTGIVPAYVAPSVTRRGCPCPVRRTFADAFLASAHSMPTALRHPGFACRHTPALGARATPPPLPRSATFPRPTLRGLEDRGRPFGQPSALPATGQAKTGRMPVFRVYTANGQDARVSRVVRRSASADTRPRGGRGRGGRSPPAGRG
jgi:hypothetical protein